MTEDKRFYGVYEGICIDSNDPDGLGRIKLQVPQVTGLEVSDWSRPINGAISQVRFPYGTFHTTANQTVSGANTANIVNNWVADDTNKTYLSGTKIYVEETGDYLLLFSAVISKSAANAQDAYIWVRKNGTDVPNSNTVVTLAGSSADSVVTVSFILDLSAGDYIELVFGGVSSTTQLVYQAAASSPTRPACPGVIATLNLVSKYVPQPQAPIWVLFIGGDPNFPVWMGAQV